MGQTKRTKTVEQIVALYTEKHLTGEEISSKANISQVQVARILRAAGVRADQGERVQTPCGFCEAPLVVQRKRWHKQKAHYCNRECHHAAMETSAYHRWIPGCRRARAVVAKYFRLQADHVVHHKDFDQRNVEVGNLVVYADEAARRAYLQGRKVAPLWDGSTVAGTVA